MQENIISHRSLRMRIIVRGAVQGVGFRPFVYRLATGLSLDGWVQNSSQGVVIEIEGKEEVLDLFLHRLSRELPPLAFIDDMQQSFLPWKGYSGFEIRKSDVDGTCSTIILPDIAVCPDCIRELFTPTDRRFLYPFINCTNCGPRFSIIEAVPYDRPNTTMKRFPMCPECKNEYEDPFDRRFHAQPIACHACGPHVELWDADGSCIGSSYESIKETVNLLRSGNIVAVKGLGGFHIMADARNGEVIQRLRHRKHREEKPFALMFPAMEAILKECEITPMEQKLLTSSESPIVLLRKRNEGNSEIDESVAPRNSNYGVLVPYTPLHHLLMNEAGFPVVATSGNRTDEPMCIDENEALRRLNGIADYFLVHNRPIKRHVDDSIVKVVAGCEQIQRRARGYTPLPVRPGIAPGEPILATGAHLKNTVAIAGRHNIIVGQHIGDLETKEAYDAFTACIRDLKTLFEVSPEKIVCDLHPDYLSTCYAENSAREVAVEKVQHHYAHVASCMAEHSMKAPVLGVAWDGTGYGPDGTIWGGEFFLITDQGYERAATFRTFPLPGGDRAITLPRRSALGMLFEIFGKKMNQAVYEYMVGRFPADELSVLKKLLAAEGYSPRTSSAGRIFDAVASFAGVRHQSSFEGQAAMELEFMAEQGMTDEVYPFVCRTDRTPVILDWEPMILALLEDASKGYPSQKMSAKFHNTMAECIVAIAKHTGQKKIVLSGGCFQNTYLLEHTIMKLREHGFEPFWHRRIPTNDGGISLGQIYASILAQAAKNQYGEGIKQMKTNRETLCV